MDSLYATMATRVADATLPPLRSRSIVGPLLFEADPATQTWELEQLLVGLGVRCNCGPPFRHPGARSQPVVAIDRDAVHIPADRCQTCVKRTEWKWTPRRGIRESEEALNPCVARLSRITCHHHAHRRLAHNPKVPLRQPGAKAAFRSAWRAGSTSWVHRSPRFP